MMKICSHNMSYFPFHSECWAPRAVSLLRVSSSTLCVYCIHQPNVFSLSTIAHVPCLCIEVYCDPHRQSGLLISSDYHESDRLEHARTNPHFVKITLIRELYGRLCEETLQFQSVVGALSENLVDSEAYILLDIGSSV